MKNIKEQIAKQLKISVAGIQNLEKWGIGTDQFVNFLVKEKKYYADLTASGKRVKKNGAKRNFLDPNCD